MADLGVAAQRGAQVFPGHGWQADEHGGLRQAKHQAALPNQPRVNQQKKSNFTARSSHQDRVGISIIIISPTSARQPQALEHSVTQGPLESEHLSTQCHWAKRGRSLALDYFE